RSGVPDGGTEACWPAPRAGPSSRRLPVHGRGWRHRDDLIAGDGESPRLASSRTEDICSVLRPPRSTPMPPTTSEAGGGSRVVEPDTSDAVGRLAFARVVRPRALQTGHDAAQSQLKAVAIDSGRVGTQAVGLSEMRIAIQVDVDVVGEAGGERGG